MRTGITDRVRSLRLSGKSIDEICEIVNYSRHEVLRICRKSGMGVTDEEKQTARDRVNKGLTHTEEWAKQYIFEKSEGRLKYLSGYTNMDSRVFVKCTKCGYEQQKAFCTFRTTEHVLCNACRYNPYAEMKREQRIKEKEDKKKLMEIKKETQRLIKAGSGKQLSMCFCECGELRDPRYKQCHKCIKAASNKRNELKRHRKVSNAMVDKDITLARLFQKDHGFCYICGERCDWNDKTEINGTIICGNQYPSIDHVIPLAKGGLHSWKNVKLAHRICNSLKSDKVV